MVTKSTAANGQQTVGSSGVASVSRSCGSSSWITAAAAWFAVLAAAALTAEMLLKISEIILMKQILILYFCYFEPMSLWYTTFTRNSGTEAVQRQLRPSFLILLARHADIKNSLLYTVHRTARPADRLTA